MIEFPFISHISDRYYPFLLYRHVVVDSLVPGVEGNIVDDLVAGVGCNKASFKCHIDDECLPSQQNSLLDWLLPLLSMAIVSPQNESLFLLLTSVTIIIIPFNIVQY